MYLGLLLADSALNESPSLKSIQITIKFLPAPRLLISEVIFPNFSPSFNFKLTSGLLFWSKPWEAPFSWRSEPSKSILSSTSRIVKLACVDKTFLADSWSLTPASSTLILLPDSTVITGSLTPNILIRLLIVSAVALTAASSIVWPSLRGSTWYSTSNPPWRSSPRFTFCALVFVVKPIEVKIITTKDRKASILLDFFFSFLLPLMKVLLCFFHCTRQ